jgi:aminopeptidase C
MLITPIDNHRALKAIEHFMERRTHERLLRRAWNKAENSDELNELRDKLHDAYERFMVRFLAEHPKKFLYQPHDSG